MIYNFKEDDAYDFARHIGAKTKKHGDQLKFKECPYCHGRGSGNEDTFAISLKTGQFNCLRASCGVTGNMIRLSRDFDFSLGRDIDAYYRPQKNFKPVLKKKEPIIPKSAAVKYLESRGISQQIAEKYEITTQTNKDNILVFPFRDEEGVMWFAKYRKIDYDKDKDKGSKEWCQENCKPILFGMFQCNPDNKTLIITEGQMDSLSVAEADIENAVSVPTGAKGFTWVPYCWDWVNKFEEIIVFGDYEKGHITLLDDISKRFKLRIKHVREEDYKGCKDANEILLKYGRGQIKYCIESAVAIPTKNVIDLSDVETVDVFELEKLKTGIKQLDNLLYGGLPFGGVTLITGKAGKGKSTLASQILAQAIYQGHICFAYSGELPNYLFRAWLDFQIAGRSHVIDGLNSWGDRRLVVSKTNRELIANWYKGKCFIYDSSLIEDDEKEDLIEAVENTILRQGARVILIDNLMTALDLDSSAAYDKYDKQSNFVKRLTRIALRYDALILLVAHKRKNNFGTNENDEVAGSSDITNLGMITLSYDSDREIDEDQRLLKVSKNRLFGKVETDGFILDYDEKSKRITGSGDDLDYDFGWCPDGNEEKKKSDSTEDGFTKIDGDIPFKL